MRFKDRGEAAQELSKHLKRGEGFSKKNFVIVSLLRGGVIVGDVLSKKLRSNHLGLVVTKISSAMNPELAIGAVSFDVTYLEKEVIHELKISPKEISTQIIAAEQKFTQTCLQLNIKESDFEDVNGKNVLLVDDGIATGATAKAGALFMKSKGAKSVALAVPVAPTTLDLKGFDNIYILYKDFEFKAVSQYYDFFPQVEDEEVKKLLESKK